MIIEVLKRYASEKKQYGTEPLNQAQILAFLKADYPILAEEFTVTKLKRALEKIVAQESELPEQNKVLRYHKQKHKNSRITGYWTANSLSDPELKFLIDSVMYGNIINTPKAQNLARRIQGLSGKNLKNITPYVTGSYGKQKYRESIDVLENVNTIMKARAARRRIDIILNVYGLSDGEIKLQPKGEYTVSPLEIVLHEGRYYLLAAFDGKNRLYYFRIDLINYIHQLEDRARLPEEFPELRNFQRDQFMRRHPVMYDGEERRFRIRIHKDSLTRAVDTFSDSLTVLPNTETEDTVDLTVVASTGAMKYWLLQHGDIAQALDLDPAFADELRESVNALQKMYG